MKPLHQLLLPSGWRSSGGGDKDEEGDEEEEEEETENCGTLSLASPDLKL